LPHDSELSLEIKGLVEGGPFLWEGLEKRVLILGGIWYISKVFRQSNGTGTKASAKGIDMVLVLLNIVILWLAPLIYWFASRHKAAWRTVETLTQVSIVGVVSLLLMPECVELAGFIVVVPALFGLLFPTFVERLWVRQATQVHNLSLYLVIIGLAIHGLMDGVGLALPEHGHGHAHSHETGEFLSLGILLHQLPVGLLIWNLFYKKRGWFFSFSLLLFLGLATIPGYYLADSLIAMCDETWLAYFQALIAGSLLHIVFDRHDDGHSHIHSCSHAHHS